MIFSVGLIRRYVGNKSDVRKPEVGKVIPIYGKDEMNLIEFPLGPITPTGENVIEVDHVVRDRRTKREVTRKLVVRGAEGLGLPRPFDDRVLVGMQALTYEAGSASRKVWFSRYHLCRTLGWDPDGRLYKRLDESFDRIGGATLKFTNAWWDKGEQEWRSHLFHIIDNAELCSKERYENARQRTGKTEQALCFFVWNEVVWKSFQDGHIRTLDMEMFRRVSNGYRREVPTRLYRWLAKGFWDKSVITFDVMKLCVGTLGISVKYPSHAVRALARSAKVLVDCGFIETFRFRAGKNGRPEVVFVKKKERRRSLELSSDSKVSTKSSESIGQLSDWLVQYTDEELNSAEEELLASGFGNNLELKSIQADRKAGNSVRESGFVRQLAVKRFIESKIAA